MESPRRLTLALFLLWWPGAVHGRLSPIAGRGAGDDAPAADGDDGEAFESFEASPGGRRALGGLLPEFFDLDPRSTVPRSAAPAAVSDVRPAAVTVAVYLVPDVRGGRPPALPRPMSLFVTDALRRHGTGRVEWDVVEYARCDAEGCAGPAAEASAAAPCLAVVGHASPCRREVLGCNYPRCLSVLVGDELCQQGWSDLRTYRTSNMPAKGYVPLGMRSDSWRSLVAIRSEAGHEPAPPSRRRYAFNAMFSISTNASRERLSYIVEGNAAAWRARTGMEAYVRMSNWFGDPNERRSDQTTTEEYMRVLLDSVFTVSPAGHNPECFRMYEAVEAGSILITTRDDLVSVPDASREGAPGCPDALALWSDAPMVVLDSWDDLYPEVERRMSDPAGLDAMQRRSAEWYGRMMGGTVGELEDFLLGSFAGEGR